MILHFSFTRQPADHSNLYNFPQNRLFRRTLRFYSWGNNLPEGLGNHAWPNVKFIGTVGALASITHFAGLVSVKNLFQICCSSLVGCSLPLGTR